MTETTEVTVYTTQSCGHCRVLKRALRRHHVEVTEIDIEAEPRYAALIEDLTGGHRTVPTVKVGADTYLVNPSAQDVLAAINEA